LLRSPNTDSFDIIELAEEVEWFVWKGLVESEYRVSIECNECEVGQDETCNYNGVCVDEKCDCNEDHFGIFCEFERPCDVIRCKWHLVYLSISNPPGYFIQGSQFNLIYHHNS